MDYFALAGYDIKDLEEYQAQLDSERALKDFHDLYK